MAATATKAKGKAKARDDVMDEDEDSGPQLVTLKMLAGWQRSILQHHSLRAFRRLLLAFRAAAHMGSENYGGEASSYVVNDAQVFNKLIVTTLKYVPVVLAHHIPYKETNSRYKLPTNSPKFTALQRPIQSYYSNLHRLLRTLPEPSLVYVVVSESAKMVPWLLHSRKLAREHVKVSQARWCACAWLLTLRSTAAAGPVGDCGGQSAHRCVPEHPEDRRCLRRDDDGPVLEGELRTSTLCNVCLLTLWLAGRVPELCAVNKAHDGAHASVDQLDEE
jgi:hypothetical protein